MPLNLKHLVIKIPGVILLLRLLQGIKIPGLNGLSLYNLITIYINGIAKGAFSIRASAISYSLFLAIFPFLLFLLNLIPFVPFENFQEEFIAFINSVLPPNTSDFFDGVITDIVKNKRGGLLSSTFLLSMFLMTNGINSVFSGFNNSYHTGISHSFLKQYGLAFGVAIIVALLLISTVYITLYLTYLVNTYDIYLIGDALFWLVSGRILFVILMVFFNTSVLFYFGTKEGRKNRFFSAGALLTTILIITTTYLFGFYIQNFSSYNEIYGSIGALLILTLYIWLNSNLILLGYELNASITKLKTQTINTKKT